MSDTVEVFDFFVRGYASSCLTGLLGFNTVSSVQVQNHLQAAGGMLGGSCHDGRMLVGIQGPKAGIWAPQGWAEGGA